MTPEYYSFLAKQVDRLSRSGAAADDLERVAFDFLSRERAARATCLPNNVVALSEAGGRAVRAVESEA